MIAYFHRAKHWQLFTILIGTLVIFELLFFTNFLRGFNFSSFANRTPNFSSFFWLFIPMMIIVMAIVFGWQWSIGWGLKDKLPSGVYMNFKRFKAFMIIPIIILLLFLILLLGFISKMENAISTANPFAIFELIYPMMLTFIIMLPLQLFATFCLFHNFYFCAKVLKSIEYGREAELGDYIGYFFLFWFYFIGFWIIQPSVNRITSPDWTSPPPPSGFPLGAVEMQPNRPIDLPNVPSPAKEIVPPGERLKTKNHDAFEHDDDFDGLF